MCKMTQNSQELGAQIFQKLFKGENIKESESSFIITPERILVVGNIQRCAKIFVREKSFFFLLVKSQQCVE